jgi:hypothetical protein
MVAVDLSDGQRHVVSDAPPATGITRAGGPGGNPLVGEELSTGLMAFIELAGQKQPRIVETGWIYWYWLRWVADGTGVPAIAGGAGSDAHIGLVPIREGAKPTGRAVTAWQYPVVRCSISTRLH